MKNILYITTSPRGPESASIQLAQELLRQLKMRHEDLTITTVDLSRHPPPFLSSHQVGALFAPLERQSESERTSFARSDEYVAQLRASDTVIINYPVWNFFVPASLKAWVDQVVRPGVTFRYGNDGRTEGLVLGKKVYLVLARGGLYPRNFDGDPASFWDFSTHYMKTVLTYLGMTDISVVKAEGLAIPGVKEHALLKAMESVHA